MRLPTGDDYEWALQFLTAAERMQLDELVLEIVAAEVDRSSPDQIEALAHVFAGHVLTCEEHLRGTGLELAAACSTTPHACASRFRSIESSPDGQGCPQRGFGARPRV